MNQASLLSGDTLILEVGHVTEALTDTDHGFLGRIIMPYFFLFILDVQSRRISGQHAQTTLGFWEVPVACLVD